MANDMDFTITVEEKGCFFTLSCDSKLTPYNVFYKLDEEFEFTVSGKDEPIKSIETACGDTYTMMQKNSKVALKMVTKVSKNFMFNFRSKMMYQRSC
jgi:hypothetical protein